ncbi:hypothetical protein ACJMK2_010103, partial [Sinanodonta woodiana]
GEFPLLKLYNYIEAYPDRNFTENPRSVCIEVGPRHFKLIFEESESGYNTCLSSLYYQRYCTMSNDEIFSRNEGGRRHLS